MNERILLPSTASELKASPSLSLAFLSDLDRFKALALPLLQEDKTTNTLALSAVAEAQPGAHGTVLGLLTCTSCSTPHRCVLVSPGFKGIGCQLYVAPAPMCQASAALIAEQLQNLPCTTVSTTAAGAALLLPLCNWKPAHFMNAMLYKPQAAGRSSNAAADTAGTPAVPVLQGEQGQGQLSNTDGCGTGHTPEAAAVSVPASSSCDSGTVHLHTCSADNPYHVQLVHQWAGNFLTEVFHLPSPPPASQVSAMVTPRLQRGLYHVLTDAAGVAVCMASHYPTSSSSTRITMLYTPQEFRGRGFGRQAVCQLCLQLVAQGYADICLMADQAEPAVNRLYQAVGFVVVGQMVMAERPVDGAPGGPAAASQN